MEDDGLIGAYTPRVVIPHDQCHLAASAVEGPVGNAVIHRLAMCALSPPRASANQFRKQNVGGKAPVPRQPAHEGEEGFTTRDIEPARRRHGIHSSRERIGKIRFSGVQFNAGC